LGFLIPLISLCLVHSVETTMLLRLGTMHGTATCFLYVAGLLTGIFDSFDYFTPGNDEVWRVLGIPVGVLSILSIFVWLISIPILVNISNHLKQRLPTPNISPSKNNIGQNHNFLLGIFVLIFVPFFGIFGVFWDNTLKGRQGRAIGVSINFVLLGLFTIFYPYAGIYTGGMIWLYSIMMMEFVLVYFWIKISVTEILSGSTFVSGNYNFHP